MTTHYCASFLSIPNDAINIHYIYDSKHRYINKHTKMPHGFSFTTNVRKVYVSL